MRLRATSAALIAALVAVCLILSPHANAQEEDLLRMTSTVTYNVKTEGPVNVVWDVTLVNNDPATTFGGSGQILFYDALALPVLRGAADVSATDSDGATLDVTVDDPAPGAVIRARVSFARPLFYQQTYSFRMTYTMPEDARSDSVVITPVYAFIPAIAAGDQATVIVNTPAGDPWEVSVDAQDCEGAGTTFTCTGSDSGYVAAIVEVSQPGAMSSLTFDVQLDATVVNVDLRFFQGEDAAAAHQQDIITTGLPIIEDVYGFAYGGPGTLHVTHGGRQAVFGYEGLASCGDLSCDVVISPIADDYTVLHELAHMWSDIYSKRWLSEGFAELVSREAAVQMRDLVQGAPPDRPQADVLLQLDDWGSTESLIGADEEQLKTVAAGYDYSLRFMEELRDELGLGALQSANRAIAAGSTPADSRLYMDVLEDTTVRNLDHLFLLWVWPDTYEQTITDRRQAKDRLAALASDLGSRQLPLDITESIEADIRAWSFDSALASLDAAEANLATYADLLTDLSTLEFDARGAGLVLPGEIGDQLNAFQFEDVQGMMNAARAALESYVLAESSVDAPRSIWERFGLLGSNPEGELERARDAFEQGEFESSREHSEEAQDTIDDASSVAFMRLLVVLGVLGVLLLALVVAFAVSRIREHLAAAD